MPISDDVIAQVLAGAEDEHLRQRLADVMTREYTFLSELAGRAFELAGELEEFDVSSLRGVQRETLEHELRRCQIAISRLSMLFEEVADKVDDLVHDQ
jgi:hypothetical protein